MEAPSTPPLARACAYCIEMGTNRHAARAMVRVMSDVIGHAPTAAARKMRLHRQRRRAGMRVARVELRRDEIDALVRLGYLAEVEGRDAGALGSALALLLDRLPPPNLWPLADRGVWG
jgi:hypothetical protein